MAKSKLDNILELIDQSETIGLITHIDGDGDAFGSVLGLAGILRTIGKKVVIFSNEPLNYFFDFMKGDLDYQPVCEYQPVDLLIGLDGNYFGRYTLPEIPEAAQKAGAKIAIIDHHELSDAGDYVDIYWGDPAISSASEMVYRLSVALKLKLDKITATAILLGIETDTFSLQFENSKPEVFLAVADLLGQGARLKPIIESAFGGKPLPMALLLGRVMERVKLTRGGMGVSYVTLADKKELGLTDKASSGVANFLDQIKEAKAVIVFEEIEEGLVKASLRSNGSSADVAQFAGYFGGGGHKRAAGFKFKANLAEVIPNFS